MGKETVSTFVSTISEIVKTDFDQFLEVLAEGFCRKCHFLLRQRLHVLLRSNTARRRHYPRDSTPESFNDCECSSDHADRNGYTPKRRHRSPEHDTYSSKRVYATHSPSEENRKRKIIQYSESEENRKRKIIQYSESEENKKRRITQYSDSDLVLDDGIAGVSAYSDSDLSEERKEILRFSKVRKKEFVLIERINGKAINVLQGLELHTGVFNDKEQKNIVDFVQHLQHMGRQGNLRERTYSKPKKWMRGKGRVTLQFGCCYNYAEDKKGNPPGIVRDEKVDPMPPLFKKMIKRMVRWHILPTTCIPDSCIVNIYDEGDCIPPHIDHHDFLRPFCTVSFLTQCNILLGSRLKILSPGEFSGPVSISLPKGSVFILSGNGADIAKHCVPGVPAKRISITFRKMDERKLPYRYLPDPELQGIKSLDFSQSQEEEEENILERRNRKRNHSDHSDSTQDSTPAKQTLEGQDSSTN